MGYGYGAERGFGMMYGGGFGGGIFMLALLVIILIGIFLIIHTLKNSKQTSDKAAENTAMEILRQRYARGEISHEEFEKMKTNLL